MKLQGVNVGTQLGQPVLGCPGWVQAGSEVRERGPWLAGLQDGAGAHEGRVYREGQTRS